MPASLQECPLEIVHEIVQLLDLDDVRNLRLTCRPVSIKATDDSFRSRFRNKQLFLDQNSLETFVQVTEPGRLGCLLENLVVSAPTNDTKSLKTILSSGARWDTKGGAGPIFYSEKHTCTEDELAQVQHDIDGLETRQAAHVALLSSGLDVSLLTKAFKNLAANTDAKKLQAIWMWSVVSSKNADSFELPIHGGDWSLISQMLAYIFRTVTSSLSFSGLRVETLDVASETLRCSLSTKELQSALTPSIDLQPSFCELKSLSISLFIPTAPDPKVWGDSENISTTETDGGNILIDAPDATTPSGLSRLFNLMPQLEEFDLHWYGNGNHAVEQAETQRLFQELVETTNLPRLIRCRLRGFAVTRDALLAFLQKTPLTYLRLENIYLNDGTYESIFQHCTSDDAAMEHLFFDDLYEGQYVYFDEPGGRPKFPSLYGSHGTNTLERNGPDVRKPIRYHFTTGRALGSPQAYNWHRRTQQVYGPPN